MRYARERFRLLLRPHAFRPSRIVDAIQAFVSMEASSGLVLMAAALAGLVSINSPWGDTYIDLWHSRLALHTGVFSIDQDLRHLVNDGLMTVFFFLVGLEIKRELVHGEMSTLRRAALPAIAALGGMLAPALVYAAFNSGTPGGDGWGVPMATDIAFSLGVLSLLGARVPFSAKVFLLALAIVDDIGAVAVIAVFYTSSIDLGALAIALGIVAAVAALNRAGLQQVNVYLLLGVALWLATLESGVHATLAGVAIGLLTPARSQDSADSLRRANLPDDRQSAISMANEVQSDALSRDAESPLDRLERAVHPWVSFAIVPLFSLANAGVDLGGGVVGDALRSNVAPGVALGLLAGKPLGIFVFSWLAVRAGLCELPSGSNWSHILGIGILGGIGFTVSLLIAGLAFDDALLVDEAKLAVLAASVVAGVLGYVLLRLVDNRNGTTA